jgi:hypothetical protein
MTSTLRILVAAAVLLAAWAGVTLLAHSSQLPVGLTLVLDCSASMGPEKSTGPYGPRTPCKYHEITEVVRKVLAEVPEATVVSVFTVSQAAGSLDEKGKPRKEQPAPEATIQRVLDPVSWNDRRLAGLMEELELQRPYNERSLVRAMVEAKERGFPANFRGRKLMLVLTDGPDNRFARDTRLHARQGTADLAQFLEREFGRSDVSVRLVGYKVSAKEAPTLQKQFEPSFEKFALPGRFFTTDSREALAKRLTELVRVGTGEKDKK